MSTNMDLISTLFGGDYQIARFIIQRGVGVVYLLAFINAFNQFIPLSGTHGLQPITSFLDQTPFKRKPSIFQWYYSDHFFKLIAGLGIGLSIMAIIGLPGRIGWWLYITIWFLLWALYLSIVNTGSIFYGFGWESMLLEVGFYTIFLGPVDIATPILVIWMIRWTLFRVEFGAGLIKIRGDACWRDLTCLNYHHETQPMPNPLSRLAHLLPEKYHAAETLFNHIIQLVLVWGLFFPQPIASIAALCIILSQAYLMMTGNYAWLNFLTIIMAFSGINDQVYSYLLSVTISSTTHLPIGYLPPIIILSLIVIYLSIKPIKNMFSPGQMMNVSFNPFHLVNTYGAFGSVTKKRYEIIIEGTDDEHITDETTWKPYTFKGKPGDRQKGPVQIAPYHFRLDWQMWFAAISNRRPRWFESLIFKLLENDETTIKLLQHVPFSDEPPTAIRARLFHYQFTDSDEREKTGCHWKRTLITNYLPHVSLE